jgi:hypothetical protein
MVYPEWQLPDNPATGLFSSAGDAIWCTWAGTVFLDTIWEYSSRKTYPTQRLDRRRPGRPRDMPARASPWLRGRCGHTDIWIWVYRVTSPSQKPKGRRCHVISTGQLKTAIHGLGCNRNGDDLCQAMNEFGGFLQQAVPSGENTSKDPRNSGKIGWMIRLAS